METFMESTQVIFSRSAEHSFVEPEPRRLPAEVAAATLTVDGVDHIVYNRENRVGRSDICDVVIKSKAVSTVHATIDAEDPANHFICDLNSTNSTRLGSAVLKPRVQYFIKNGETITFANVTGIYKYIERAKDTEAHAASKSEEIIDTSASPAKNDGSDLMFETPLKDDRADPDEVVPSSSPLKGKLDVVNPLIFDMATQPFQEGCAESPGSSVYDMLTEPPFPISENPKFSEPFPVDVVADPQTEESQKSEENNDVTVVAAEPVLPLEVEPERIEPRPSDEKAVRESVLPPPQRIEEETNGKPVTPPPRTSEDETNCKPVVSPIKPICTFNIVDDPAAESLPNKKRFAKKQKRVILDGNSEEANSSDSPSVRFETKSANSDENSSETTGFRLSCIDTQAPLGSSEENPVNLPAKPTDKDLPSEDIYCLATQAVTVTKEPSSNLAVPEDVEPSAPAAKRSSLGLNEAETQLVIKKEDHFESYIVQPHTDSILFDHSLSDQPTQLVPKKIVNDRERSPSCENLQLNLSEIPTQLVLPSTKKDSFLCESQYPLLLAISEETASTDNNGIVSGEFTLSDLPTQAVKHVEAPLDVKAKVESIESDEDDIIPCSQPVAEDEPHSAESNNAESSRTPSPVCRSRAKKVPPLPATQIEDGSNSGVDPGDGTAEKDDDELEFCSPVLRTTPRKLVPLPDTQLDESDAQTVMKEIIDESEAVEVTADESTVAFQEEKPDCSAPKEDVILETVASENLIIEQGVESENTPRHYILSDDENEEICLVTPTRSTSRKVSAPKTSAIESPSKKYELIKEDDETLGSSAPLVSSLPDTVRAKSPETLPSNIVDQRSSSPDRDVVKTVHEKEKGEPPSAQTNSPSSSSSRESPVDKLSIFDTPLEKPRVKKYYNRNRLSNNSCSFLLKEPTATSTPVRLARFEDSPSGKVYETPDKSPDDVSKKAVTIFSDTIIPQTNTLKQNNKKSSHTSNVLRQSSKSSISSDDSTSTSRSGKRRISKSSPSDNKRAAEEASDSAKSNQRQVNVSYGTVTPGRGRLAKKKTLLSEASSTESMGPTSTETKKKTKTNVKLKAQTSVDSQNSSLNEENISNVASSRRSARRKVAEKQASPQPENPPSSQPENPSTPLKMSREPKESQLSTPSKLSVRRSPLKYGKASRCSSFDLHESQEMTELKVPSRSVTDLSFDSSQEEDLIQRRPRRPPNRIMDDSFQPIPFVPGNRINPKSPAKAPMTDSSKERNSKSSSQGGSESQELHPGTRPSQEPVSPVKRPGRPLKRPLEPLDPPGTSNPQPSESTALSTPSKRALKAADVNEGGLEAKPYGRRRGRPARTDGALTVQDSHNSLDDPQERNSAPKGKGRRGLPHDTGDAHPVTSPVKEEPKIRERQGKNQLTEDSQHSQVTLNSQELPRGRGRPPKAKAPKIKDYETTALSEVVHEVPKTRGRPRNIEGSEHSQVRADSLEISKPLGRRGRVPNTNKTHPSEESQSSHEEPKIRGRQGKGRLSQNSLNSQQGPSGINEQRSLPEPDDTQPSMIPDQGEPEKLPKPRGRPAKRQKLEEAQQLQSNSHPESSKTRDGRQGKIALTLDEGSQSTQADRESQSELPGVKRSGRVRKKKLPFDELSIEKEKEVLAKKQQEKTTRKRGNTNVSVEYDVLPKNPRKESTHKNFVTPTSPAIRGETRARGRASSSSSISSFDSSNRSASSSSSARKKKGEKVMFTGYSNKSMETLVKKLGGEMVSCPYSCSVLVTDQVRRTVKFLCALSRGISIVSVKWLNSCRATNSFTDPAEWILEDKEAEKKFSFNLQTSLNQAKSIKFLDGWKVYVTPSVKPVPSEMKMIVECSGGKFLSRAPAATSDKTFVVSCPEDRSQWVKLWKSNQPNRPPIVSAEALLSGVLQQKLDLQKHLMS